MQSVAHLVSLRRAHWQSLALGLLVLAASGQSANARPTPGSSCTISALNRNAPVAADDSYVIYNIPGNSGPFRARVSCSDGTLGQTAIAFPEIGTTEVFPGPIIWGNLTPTPIALDLTALKKQLSTGEKAQLKATAIAADASTHDVTKRVDGTSYVVSNALLASITQDGLLEVLPLFATGSSARVVVSATNEGGVSGSYMFVLGPRGSLRGKVVRADGVTPVANAQVSVMRHQPNEIAGTAITDASGNYQLNEVNAGTFSLTVIDPVSGDRGQSGARIEQEGQVVQADIKLNGQGQVEVVVLDAAQRPVANAVVTMTALGRIRDTRTTNTDANGRAVFANVAAGDVTVSTRDPVTRLLGSTLGVLEVGANLSLQLKLQPVGTIEGVVYGADGSSLQEGVQVRILSRERGILSQSVTGTDGKFSFTSLPLSDGPYTLDAFVENRLRARVPNVVISQPNQVVVQNLQYTAVGTVQGVITDSDNRPFTEVSLVLQTLEGLRLSFNAKAGPDGRYMIQGVPPGNFNLNAVTPDGRAASSSGSLRADAEILNLNLQLASTGIVGTVFQRDGVTPVGAGVQVYLQRNPNSSQLQLDLNPTSPAVVGSVQTNAQGQYAFSVAHPDVYVVQAQDGSNRGRTQAVLTKIVPGQPATVNLAFLGKGTVSGVVKDGSGNLQSGVSVKVSSLGAFSNTWSTQTDANGRYQVNNVFVGDLAIQAQNDQTRLAGVANGRMLAEGDQVGLDVILAATGTVRGSITRRDGSLPELPLQVQLQAGGTQFATLNLESGNRYEFNLVPLGEIRVTVTEKNTGDKGMAQSRLSAANESKNLDVRLIGQGAVKVKVQDAQGRAVAGAKVQVLSLSAFGGGLEANSDAQGEVLLKPVFNGDFTVSASKPAQIGQISGSAQGTIVGGSTEQVSITLNPRPTGRVQGVVLAPNGVTPVPNMVVSLGMDRSFVRYRTTSDAQGKFVLENVEGGTGGTLVARKYERSDSDRDRVRAQSAGVLISAQDEVIVRNLQMIGAGEVSGVVKRADGTPLSGIKVIFNNPDTVYGTNPATGNGNYTTFSESDGKYRFADMAAGNFTLRAENADLTLRAEADGRIRFDQDKVTRDLTMVDSAISMPYTLHDANAMPFDIHGDGSVRNGKNGVFTGSGPDVRGLRLDVLVGGVPVPFMNGDGSIGRISQNRQQVEVDELHTSGLNISRRTYVPKDGYFARYLEVLENNSDAPITVDLRLTSHHSQSDSNPRVVDSSDGDDVLSVADRAHPDRWVIVDDQQDSDPFKSSSIPATGHIFDGAGAAKQVHSAGYELIGQTGRLRWQYNGITVAPGQRVALMHFAFNQLDRSRAREAALRLAQLPPEALAGMSEEERLAVQNFAVPRDGSSTVPALPLLDGAQISGKVLSGDGITRVPGAAVHFKSKHPLFGRDLHLNSDANGQFVLQARVDGSASSFPLPHYAFDLDARHPVTGVTSAAAVNDFPPNVPDVQQDLIFEGTANIRGSVKRPGGGFVANAQVSLMVPGNPYPVYRTRTAADGTYLMTGVPPRDYLQVAEQEHPQKSDGCCGIEGSAPVAAIGGATTVADVQLETVGAITGIVRSAGGQPVVGAVLKLTDSLNRLARRTVSDTAGRYRFADVKLGTTVIEGYDEVSRAGGSASVKVEVDKESVADLTLRGFGRIEVQVNFARGAPAPGSKIEILGKPIQPRSSDTAGKANFNVPVDSYSLRAYHPDDSNSIALSGEGEVQLQNNGDIVSLTLNLKPAAVIKGTIVRPDGSTLAGGFPFSVRRQDGASHAARSGNTDAVGNFRIAGLAPGNYLLTAYDPEKNRFADAELSLSSDGEEVVANLRLEDNRIQLPANLWDANRFVFDVQNAGQLLGATAVFEQAGGLQLQVNGENFRGDSSALLEAGKRQFAITQPSLVGGLKVTRKVYVPRGAYFARYLEIFENPGATEVSVNVNLRSQYRQAQLIASASGQTQAERLGPLDHWFVLDDALDGDWMINPQQPTTAHVQGQTGARANPDQISLQVNAQGTGELQQAWSNLRVPAGGKVALLHFVVQQINRNGANHAAQRLQQLPPEVLQDLSAEEKAAIVNFTVPASSSLQSLPALTGNVSGRVFEGDGVTVTERTRVTVQSSHPLFSRVWGMQRDNDPWRCPMPGTPVGSLVAQTLGNPDPNRVVTGAYSLQGVLNDSASIALPMEGEIRVVAQEPQGCFGEYAGHPVTHIPSRSYTLENARAQDVLYDSGILTGTVSGPADLGVTTGRVWRATDNPDYPDFFYVPVAADGTYVFPGLSPGTYDMLADVPHPQGSRLRGERMASSVTLGRTTVTDIQLQATGSVSGVILTANGEASVNAKVVLSGAAAAQQYDACLTCVNPYGPNRGKRDIRRETRTDSLGRYQFSAVPVGQYGLEATDPISDAKKQVSLAVQENQRTVQNLTLLGLGSVQLTVTKAMGAPAADANVYLFADAEGFEKLVGRTNSAGKLTIANVPVGNYRLRVMDPRHLHDSRFQRELSGTMDSNGQVQQQSARLLAVATLRLKSVDGDNGNLPLPNTYLELDRISVGVSGADATVLVPGAREGTHEARIYVELDGSNTDTRVSFNVQAEDDDQVREILVPAKRTLGSIRLLVLDKDRNNVPVTNAAITLQTVRGTWNMGNTDANGTLFIPGVAPGAVKLTARAQLNGVVDEASVNGEIRADSLGQPLPLTISFEKVLYKRKALSFSGERHLYSVPVRAGDVLALSIKGAAIDSTPAAYLVRASVFDLNKTRVASGYGFGPQGNYQQYNEQADLRNVRVAADGNYSITLSPYYSNVEYLGGYEVGITVNGVPVTIQNYADGGKVQGKLSLANGNPVAAGMVRLRTQNENVNTLGTYLQTTTDEQGQYQFEGVPLGGLTVAAYVNGQQLVSVPGSLSQKGEVLNLDLVRPAVTQVRVKVEKADGSASQSTLVRWEGGGNNSGSSYTDEAGFVNLQYVGDGQLSLSAYGQSNAMALARAQVRAADGQNIEVKLVLRSASVTGRALLADGSPLAYGVIQINLANGTDGSDGAQIGRSSTDSEGNFLLPEVLAEEDLIISANAWNNRSQPSASRPLRLQTGQDVRDLILQLPGKGRASGKLLSSAGRVMVSQPVYAYWTDLINGSGYRYAYTNEQGQFTLDDLPVGLELKVQHSYTRTGQNTPTETVLKTRLSQVGEHKQLPDMVVQVGATVVASWRTVDGDMPTVWGYCRFSLTSATLNYENSTYCDAEEVYLGLQPGQVTITLSDNNSGEILGSKTVTAVDNQEVRAIIALSKIIGNVRYADGSAVQYPNVYLTDANGQTINANNNDEGLFSLIGAARGSFQITAQDNQTGLSVTRTAEMSNPEQVMRLDLTLPATGSVQGTVYDANRQPQAGAQVWLRHLESGSVRSLQADDQGHYSVDQVALGALRLAAQSGSSTGSNSGSLNSSGQQLQLDVELEAGGQVEGSVLAADGVTPVANAIVRLRMLETDLPFNAAEQEVSSDDQGRFNFSDVAKGRVVLQALDNNGAAAFALTQVNSGALSVQDLRMGNAVPVPVTLSGSNGVEYNLASGVETRYEWWNPYRQYYALEVNGVNFEPGSVGLKLQDGREYQFGPSLFGGVEVTRRFYQPADGAYLRMLESFTNTSASTQTVTVRILGAEQMGEGQLSFRPVENGDGYLIYTTPDYGDGDAGNVFITVTNAAGSTRPVQSVAFVRRNASFKYGWNLSLAPGETAKLMHFTGLFMGENRPNAVPQAQALSTGRAADMLQGLSAQDKAAIINFNLP